MKSDLSLLSVLVTDSSAFGKLEGQWCDVPGEEKKVKRQRRKNESEQGGEGREVADPGTTSLIKPERFKRKMCLPRNTSSEMDFSAT